MKIPTVLIVAAHLALLGGCASNAIVPLRMTYTYPPAEGCGYQAESACGAIAFWNDKSIELYLPNFGKSLRNKPQRFEFTPSDGERKVWRGKAAQQRGEPDITARFVLADQADTPPNAEFHRRRGMLVVDFPADATYGELAGDSIWLTPAVDWENVKVVRGLFWESDSQLPEWPGIRFSKE